jgi:hypothetical protein
MKDEHDRIIPFAMVTAASVPMSPDLFAKKIVSTPESRFRRWFVDAVAKLRELPKGDGGIAVFMITLPLVERAAVIRLKLGHEERTDTNIKNEVGQILGLTDDGQRRIFWDMFRNGFLHLGMPLAGKTRWQFSGSYTEKPIFNDINGDKFVCLDPWKFAVSILNLYSNDPRLITDSESAPFGDVFDVMDK